MENFINIIIISMGLICIYHLVLVFLKKAKFNSWLIFLFVILSFIARLFY